MHRFEVISDTAPVAQRDPGESWAQFANVCTNGSCVGDREPQQTGEEPGSSGKLVEAIPGTYHGSYGVSRA